MTTVANLALQIAQRLNDPSQIELTATQYINFINNAIDDLSLAGWLQPQSDDTTTLVAATTYTYNVPSGFAYIKELRAEETQNGVSVYTRVVPESHWTIHLQSGLPKLFFDTISSLEVGKHIMVVGQRRFFGGLVSSDTIVSGAESFIRERALSYAAEFLAAGTDEQAVRRAKLADQSWLKSEQSIKHHPQEFRVRPNSRVVPNYTPVPPTQTFTNAYIVVDGVTYPQTEAGIAAAMLAASLVGHHVLVPGGLGAITVATGLSAYSNTALTILKGTWLEAVGDGTSIKMLSYQGASNTAVSPLVTSAKEGDLYAFYTNNLTLAAEQICWVGNAAGNDGQVNCIKEVFGPNSAGQITYEFYDPLVRDSIAGDEVFGKTGTIENFYFSGELRAGNNTGNTIGVYIVGFKNLTIENCVTQGFHGPPLQATAAAAIMCLGGYGLRCQGNRDLDSGSNGYAAIQLDGVSNFKLLQNDSFAHGRLGPTEIILQPFTIAGATGTTIQFGTPASAVDNFYNGYYVRIVGGPGTGQVRQITAYVGATKTATIEGGTIPWSVTPTNQSNAMISQSLLYLGEVIEEGFAFLINNSHWGSCAFNKGAGGKGRMIKFQGCSNITDTGSVANAAHFIGVTAYALTGGCRHFNCSNIIGKGTAASGLWIDAVSSPGATLPNSDLTFNNCDFTNNDQAINYGGFEGSADISVSSPSINIYFNNCKYKSLYVGSTGVWVDKMYVGTNGPSTPAAAINNSAAETNLFSTTLPASLLGNLYSNNRRLDMVIPYTYLNNSGAPDTIRVRGYLGTTAIADYTTAGIASSATARQGIIQLNIAALNASISAQIATGVLSVGDVVSAALGGTAAENISTALALRVTITLGTAGPNITFTPRTGTLRWV